MWTRRLSAETCCPQRVSSTERAVFEKYCVWTRNLFLWLSSAVKEMLHNFISRPPGLPGNGTADIQWTAQFSGWGGFIWSQDSFYDHQLHWQVATEITSLTSLPKSLVVFLVILPFRLYLQVRCSADPTRPRRSEAVHWLLHTMAASADVPEVLSGWKCIWRRAVCKAGTGRPRGNQCCPSARTLSVAQNGPCGIHRQCCSN